MLDKIYYRSKYEVVLIYTHRSPVTLWSGEGKIMEFLDEFLTPIGSECRTLSEYTEMIARSMEDTAIIDIDKVA